MTSALAFDTETELMTQADMAPPVVCISYAMSEGVKGLVHQTEGEAWLAGLFQASLAGGVTLVGHNTAYDLACISHTWPSLTDSIWDLYDNELVEDTIVRQKLSDLARGRYRGFRTSTGYFVPLTYDLDAVTHRHLGYRLDKDTWRLRYGELRWVPLPQWPEGALEYPVGDAVATFGVREAQEADATQYPEGPWFFVDQHAQVRAAWWLHLVSTHGIMTSADAVERLAQAAREEIEVLEEVLVERHTAEDLTVFPPLVQVTVSRAGVRKATKKKAAVQARVLHSCREQGKDPRYSAAGKEVLKALAKGEVSKTETGRVRSSDLSLYVAIDKDACLETGDPLLEAYIDYSSATKTLNADCEAYRRGAILPLHTRFESLAATGRTTSSGQSLKDGAGNVQHIGSNIQNIRWNFPERCLDISCRGRKIVGDRDLGEPRTCARCGGPADYPPGIRECFIPRPGTVFADSDYDTGELRALAQVCIWAVGASRLAEVLNAGGDPHMIVAAEILGRPLDWCLANKSNHDVHLARQTAKVANFGFPGGLGAEKLVLFARMAYKVTLTIPQAKALKQTWFRAYPEMRDYFRWVEKQKQPDGTFSIEHLVSRRLRSQIFYCVACNSPFQGLLADGAKAAGYLLARACYRDHDSPLYGCRIVNFIHDQFITEVPDDGPDFARATAAANEQDRIMVDGAAPYFPDVPLTCSAVLCRRWSKNSNRIVVAGHLVPWDG
jgi:hypothetical protein